jgi:hypothetical protein
MKKVLSRKPVITALRSHLGVGVLGEAGIEDAIGDLCGKEEEEGGREWRG